mgnify:CR=1 FL=1
MRIYDPVRLGKAVHMEMRDGVSPKLSRLAGNSGFTCVMLNEHKERVTETVTGATINEAYDNAVAAYRAVKADKKTTEEVKAENQLLRERLRDLEPVVEDKEAEDAPEEETSDASAFDDLSTDNLTRL